MDKIRISKDFVFEAAHALDNHDGKCKNIHGHSYKLTVTIEGTPKNNTEASDAGMVLDFSVLKEIVNKLIIKPYDHALVLKDDSRFLGIEKQNDKTIYSPYHPTCENMLIDFKNKITAHLPEKVELVYMKLNETANSYAEWVK